MSLYINRIYIKNFKLFNSLSQPIEIDSKNLIVLDGPNGFGKTSIFDVIELILTDKLKRIRKADSRNRYKDLLLKNNNSEESLLKVEFINEHGEPQFTLAKKIEADYSTEKNLPNDFDIFKTHILSDFNDNLSGDTLIQDYNEIVKKFGANLKEVFNLIHYVEQEDNKLLLKMNENERLEQLASLFNTEDEQQEEEYYTNLRNYVKTKKEDLTQKIASLNADIDKMNISIETETGNKEYLKLLPHLTISEPWDLEDLDIKDNTQLEKYLRDLEDIKCFIKNFEDYNSVKLNKSINHYIESPNLIQDYIIITSKNSGIEKLKLRYESQVEIFKIIKDLEKASFITKWKEIDFKKVLESNLTGAQLLSEEGYITITEKINELIKLEESSTQTSNSLRELFNIRSNFVEQFKQKHSIHPEIIDSHCPLCGNDWETVDNLIGAIEQKRSFLQSLLDDVSNTINKSLEELHSEEITNIIESGNLFFNKQNKLLISSDNHNQFIQGQRNVNNVREFEKWLNHNSIVLDQIIEKTDDYLNPKELEIKYQKIIEILKSKYNKVTNGESIVLDIEKYDLIFNRYFLNDSIAVKFCNEGAINNKISFIKTSYYNDVLKKKKELQNVLEESELYINKYNLLYKDLDNIVKEYKNKTKLYWKKIIKDIEIIFYIYSGKILQSHPTGLGIFMKESGAKSIRFITHPEKDHDVSNFMSSGQLAAITLSLTLAINKVYGNKGLSTLLIDDPLQTMDDINISSFLDLLRNDFSNKQIILSTHEEHVTKYMLYKFSNYNLETQSLNLREKYYSENI
ncbi:AAA family ATPase [Solibacillus merdavium]|uniref:AAA family ATPase n=1 Tax=Solibacillus merdavium TaxID=2762218 RepID=A0ABR8XSX2_9BACL|nr:AAA family ATPase [Solibacillus merdavium]MBD8035044.1 AAA family ATPase [Solibacillus merdavium]